MRSECSKYWIPLYYYGLIIMSKHILSTLFGSKARVKLLKFIFQHQNTPFTLKMAASRIQESKEAVAEEIQSMIDIGLIKNCAAPEHNIKNSHEESEE